MGMLDRLKGFIGQCRRVVIVANKPDLEEFKAYMKISAIGLKCLNNLKNLNEFNPESNLFNPLKVIEVLEEKGDLPVKVMNDYAKWIYKMILYLRE